MDRFYKWMRRRGKLDGQNKFPRMLKEDQHANWQAFLAERGYVNSSGSGPGLLPTLAPDAGVTEAFRSSYETGPAVSGGAAGLNKAGEGKVTTLIFASIHPDTRARKCPVSAFEHACCLGFSL